MSLRKADKLSILLQQLPEGVAAPSTWFEEQGYSRQLLYKYVQSGWLVKLGRGVYLRPGTKLDWQGVGLGLQHLAHAPFHLGGITALNQQGYAHYLPLGGEPTLHWFGKGAVPAWVNALDLPQSFQFHTRQLFDESATDVGLNPLPTKTRDWTLGSRVKRLRQGTSAFITKLVVQKAACSIKIEVSPVSRGCVHKPSVQAVQPSVEQRFGYAEMLVEQHDDVYAGKLCAALHRLLTDQDREFLLSVKRGKPDWNLCALPNAANLPAVRWKLHNLAAMKPAQHQQALAKLERALAAS
jgi:hypothetical protein